MAVLLEAARFYQGNPVAANPALRAFLVALDEWVSGVSLPPASRVPRREDGTLVPSLPQGGVGFPNIPGVTYNGLMTTGDWFAFGPMFDNGSLTVLLPVHLDIPYPAYVPTTDVDGNDIAGARLPEIAVPLATYTGWALRAAAFAGVCLSGWLHWNAENFQTRAAVVGSVEPRLQVRELASAPLRRRP